MATTTVEQIRRVVTQYESRGADKAAADLNAVAAAETNVARAGETMATVTDRSAKGFVDVAKAADVIRRRYDEQYRATQQLAREQHRLTIAHKAGAISADDYARTLDLMHAKFGIVSEAQAEIARRATQEAAAIDGAAAAQQRFNALLGVREDFGTDGRAADIAAFAREYDVYIAKLVAAKRAEEELARTRAVSAQASINTRLGVRDDFGTEARAADIAAFAREYENYIATLVRARAAEEALSRARATTAQAQINQRLGVRDDFGTEARGSDIAALGDQIQAVRERFVPLAALQRQYRDTLTDINAASRQGILTEAERADAISRTKAVYAEQVVAMRGVQDAGGRLRLAGHDLANLSYQLNDVFTMLAMGAPPFQILASQAGQIYQILSAQQGGLVGGFKALGGTIAGLVTPTGLAVTALAAVGVTATAAYASWVAGEKELQAALAGRGRILDVTGAELMAISSAAADAADITQSVSREITAALAQTGKVPTNLFVDLIASAKDYAVVINSDVATAGKELAEAFADPAKGAVELDAKLNMLDDTTLQYIRQLSAANRQGEAQAILFDRMNAVLPRAEQRLTAIGRAWEAVKNGASGAYYAVGEAINRMMTVPEGAARIVQLEKQRTVAVQQYGENSPYVKEIDKERDAIAYERELALMRSRLNQQQEQDNLKSKAGGDALRSWDGRGEELLRLRGLRASLDAAITGGKGGDIEAMKLAREGYDNQIRSMTDASGKLISRTDELRRSHELEAAALKARTPAEQAAAAAAQARHEALKRGATTAEANAEAEQAAARITIQSQVAISDATRQRLMAADEAIRAQRLEIELIGKTAAQSAEMRANYEAEAEARRRAAETGVAVSEAELAAIRAKNAELGRTVELAARASLNDDIRFEREQLGRNPFDQQIAQTQRSMGLEVDMNSAEAAAMRLNQTLSLTKDLATEAFSGFLNDLIEGENLMDSLQNASKRLLGTLVDIAAQNVMAGLFGKQGVMGSGGGNWLTDIVSGFMGFGGTSFGGGSAAVGVVGGAGSLAVPTFPKFDTGGYTGPGGRKQPAGVVHKGEVVWSQDDVHRAGGVATVEAMRKGLAGYATGGPVGVNINRHVQQAMAQAAPATSGVPKVTVNNYGAPAGYEPEAKTRVGADGGISIDLIWREFEGRVVQSVDSGHIGKKLERQYLLNPTRGQRR